MLKTDAPPFSKMTHPSFLPAICHVFSLIVHFAAAISHQLNSTEDEVSYITI